MTGGLLPGAGKIYCWFESLWVDMTGIFLRDDMASEIRLPRIGVVPVFSDRVV